MLVVRLGALGDILRTLPAVRLLRRGLPRARILWVVDPPWRVVLEGHADLDVVLPLPRDRWQALLGRPTDWTRLVRAVGDFRRMLRAERAAIALDFHGNLRSGLVAWLSGARVRVGYSGHQQKEGNRWLTTHRRPSASRRTSRVERNLDLLRALGLPAEPLLPCDLPLVAAGRAAAARLVHATGVSPATYAVVNPGASAAQSYKKPPPPLLAAACVRLLRSGIVPLVVWGPGEQADADAVARAAADAAVVAPATDLATLAGLLAGARLFVGGDSGPLHLACATGCPVLAIYGPTDPEVNRPWGVPHRVVHPSGNAYSGVKRRDRRLGFAGLDTEAVERAVDALAGETADRGSARGRG